MRGGRESSQRGGRCVPEGLGREADVLQADRGSTADALWNPFKRKQM